MGKSKWARIVAMRRWTNQPVPYKDGSEARFDVERNEVLA